MKANNKTKAPPTFDTRKKLTISAPNFQQGTFEITGNAPLVINRMSAKYRDNLEAQIRQGTLPKSKKRVFAAVKLEDVYNSARYISKAGWDGFPAGAIRAAMIAACRVVPDGPKMTLMRMSLFVEPDGWDAQESQIPLIRIYGKPVMQQDVGRDSGMNASPRLIVRPAYHDWSAKLQLRWDGDQYDAGDVFNLLQRVGVQVGIMEGRPFSRNSAGQGWGTFLVNSNIKVVGKGRAA